MKNQPKVSVIVPVYNSETYLQECLNSVLSQTLKEIEIICVYCESKDNSLDILKKNEQKDSRIKIISRPYEYVGVSRNIALNQASGKYVMFLDSDDCLYLNACYLAYNAAENNHTDCIVFNGTKLIKNKLTEKTWNYQKIIKNNISKNYSIAYNNIDIFSLPNFSWGRIYRTNFLRDNKIFFDDLKFAEDTIFIVKIALLTQNIIFLDIPIYQYRIHNDSSTFNFNNHFNDLINAYEKSYQLLLTKANNDLILSFCHCIVHTLWYFYNNFELDEKNKNIFYNRMQQLFLSIVYNHNFYDSEYQNILNSVIQNTFLLPEYQHKNTYQNTQLEVITYNVYLFGIPIFQIRYKTKKIHILLFKKIPFLKIRRKEHD